MYCKPRNNGMAIEASFCNPSSLVQMRDDTEISGQAAMDQNVLAYIRKII
jgi:hypothetical protein